jgi:hypothetical protein
MKKLSVLKSPLTQRERKHKRRGNVTEKERTKNGKKAKMNYFGSYQNAEALDSCGK